MSTVSVVEDYIKEARKVISGLPWADNATQDMQASMIMEIAKMLQIEKMSEDFKQSRKGKGATA